MKTSTLPITRCVICGSSMASNPYFSGKSTTTYEFRHNLTHEGGSEKQTIENGTLICIAEGHAFPVKDGIPHMLLPSDLAGLNQKYAALYSLIAPLYDSHFFLASYIRSRFWPSGEQEARQEIVDFLEINPGNKVLETGIGTGANVPYLREKGQPIEIFGLDIARGMLRQCRRNEPDTNLFLAAAETLPFHDQSFDVVFHVGGINAYSDVKRAMDEMIRVAKDGSCIVIADETEELALESGFLGQLGMRLYFGRKLTDEILNFRVQEVAATVPENMQEISQQIIWDGNGYLLSFRKP